MKPLFLVSSALHTKHGVFNTEQRLEQTLATILSVKSRIPDASILLLESSGAESITKEEAEKLNPYLIGLLNFHDDVQVQEVYKSTDNWDIVKNLTEIIVFSKALDFILTQQPQIIKDVDRVFKLSGRYQLSDKFDIKNFEDTSLSEKYIFAQRKASQFDPILTFGQRQQLMSRLWSFPTNKMALVLNRYQIMLEDFIGTIKMNHYLDIEHLLLKYFSGPFLHELPIIGVTGSLGPNGILVSD